MTDVAKKPNTRAIPSGWTMAVLGDLVSLIRGVSYRKQDACMEPGDGLLPILRANNIDGRLVFNDLVYVPTHYISKDQLLRPGDIVIAASSGSRRVVGKAALLEAKWEGSFGAFCMALRPSEAMESRYLGFFLQSDGYRRRVSALAAGVNINNLRRTHIETFPLPLAPRNEQERIADRLDELSTDLDAGVAALQRVQKNLERYRASVLKAAVEGRLTADWRKQQKAQGHDVEPASELLKRTLEERRRRWIDDQLTAWKAKQQAKDWDAAKTAKAEPKQRETVEAKYKPPVEPDTASLPDLPDGWCWCSLDQISNITGGITKGQKRRQEQKIRSVPYLRVANVQRGFLDLGEMKEIAATDDEIAALRLWSGDILFTEGGDRDKLGRGWIWEDQVQECIHQNHVFRARLLSDSIKPKLVSWCGNSYGREWFMKAGKQSVNLASINLTILRSFPIPLAPALEQESLVDLIEDQLSLVHAAEQTAQRGLDRASKLRQAILKRAFEGKLVDQDPADEPADALLAGIREGRGAKVGNKSVHHKPRQVESQALVNSYTIKGTG